MLDILICLDAPHTVTDVVGIGGNNAEPALDAVEMTASLKKLSLGGKRYKVFYPVQRDSPYDPQQLRLSIRGRQTVAGGESCGVQRPLHQPRGQPSSWSSSIYPASTKGGHHNLPLA